MTAEVRDEKSDLVSSIRICILTVGAAISVKIKTQTVRSFGRSVPCLCWSLGALAVLFVLWLMRRP